MKIVRCNRCNRRARTTTGWNVMIRQGIVYAHVCPTCQTPEENAEAEINIATLHYGVDALGRLVGRPRT